MNISEKIKEIGEKIMKRGFTLVEMLAVITILAVVMMLVMPSLIKSLNGGKQDAYDLQMSYIKTAAQNYVSDNRNKVPELMTIGSVFHITLGDLGDEGYLELPLVNPKTGGSFNEDTTIISVTKQTDGSYSYEIVDTLVPTLKLVMLGNNPDTVACAASGNYSDLGADVQDPLDEDAADVYAAAQPLKTAGTFTLNYSYTDANNKTVNHSRNLTITNANTPIITVTGGTGDRQINKGDSFTAPSATASDPCDGSVLVKVTSTVVPTVVGEYTVTYTATNAGGNTATTIINVIVIGSLDESGANEPEITSNMIPVYWDATNSVWRKADSNNYDSDYQWYDYDNQMWANAVTVTSTNRSTYVNAANGTVIADSDILTFLVWIPRYKYMIPSGSGARQITVAWESGTPTKSTGKAISTYRTHSSFTFGTSELTGFWIGKFESGYLGAPTQGQAERDVTTSNKIIVKPDAYSWRGIHTAKIYTVSRAMEETGNIYGFTASEVDTHFLIPTEWGAVAYLSRSVYGKNDEVWINPNKYNITGQAGTSASAASTDKTTTYYTSNGVQASTSGTVYGVYDMSGGANEYVMGSYARMSGYDEPDAENSGFNGVLYRRGEKRDGLDYPDSKYYVNYTTDKETTACSGGICYGQAYSETMDWYTDRSVPIGYSASWLHRGGDYGDTTYAGVFAYSNISCGGCNDPVFSFRIAVAIGA